jgi:hypothetical protein
MLKFLRKCFIIACVVVIAASCNSESKKHQASLTNEQAQIYARAYNANYMAKNATFVVSSGKGKGFTAKGKVDWFNGNIALDVSLDGNLDVDISAISTTSIVYEKYQKLASAESENDLVQRQWVKRAIDRKQFAVDAISQFVLSLSSKTPDNPLLVRQSKVQFHGVKKIAGQTVYTFENHEDKNAQVRYYITKDSRIVQLDVQLTGFTYAITLGFSHWGQSGVSLPGESNAYPLSDVQDFYVAQRPKF